VQTERTVVRRFEPGDAPALHAAIDASRRAILPWMLWAESDHLRVEDSVFFIEGARRKAAAGEAGEYPMGIFERPTGALLGGTGLHQVDAITRGAEVGWWLRPDRRGEGLCAEAVGGLFGQAFTPREAGGWGLHRLYARVATANAPSRKVCERLRLRREGCLREERYLGLPEAQPLGWLDILIYACLEHEWDESEGRCRAQSPDSCR
jgi:RimJ/RimL family protein N-acetyltransferase